MLGWLVMCLMVGKSRGIDGVVGCWGLVDEGKTIEKSKNNG